MRAWRVAEHGSPEEVLHLSPDVPRPVAVDDGTVEVEVRACALNFADSLLCRGTYQERPTLPFTPGLEVVGVIGDRTADDGRLRPGSRVLALTALPHGGLAEVALTHRAATFPLPDELPDATAASMLVTYQTAWVGLHRRAALRSGETVLVHGAAGGTGSAFVQLAVAAGARVIATAGGPAKIARCLELGADVAIDNRAVDVVEAVREATDGRGADVIVDTVGGDLFDASTRCIAWEGRLLVVGFAGGRIAEARTNHVMVKNYSVVGVHWPRYRIADPGVLREAHDGLVELWQTGAIEIPDPEVVPFDAAAEALTRLAGGSTVGKLVVSIS